MECIQIGKGSYVNLEHVLVENILIFLSIFPVNDAAKFWEVNVSVPHIIVCQIWELELIIQMKGYS